MATKILSGLRLGRALGVALMGSSLLLAGCDTDKLLEVKDPDTVNPGTLDDPDLMDVVWAGALGEFTTAYAGSGGDGFLSVTGLMADELHSSGSFPTRTATDRRNQYAPADGNTSDGTYVNMHQARYALKDAAKRVAEWENTSHPYYVELKALEAYTYVSLAEAFCTPIPFSELAEGGGFEYGVPISLDEVLDEAVSIFGQAGSGHLVSVGKGRALLNKGDYSAAASAVSGVPTDYVYWIYHSVNGDRNAIYSLQGNGRYSVSDNEGINGLPFRSANDPRVPWIRDPNQMWGFTETVPLYKSLRHYAFDAPLPLATGVEARLIEAEAALATGGNWLGILNDLRANWGALAVGMFPGAAFDLGATLAPLTDPGNDADRRALLFSERAFWLYGTGHRLGDLRRLVREYGLNQADVYPTGDYFKSGSFGVDVVWPLDFDEEGNNPNYQHSMCDVTSAG
jgi:hypothetical protein